MYQLLVSSTVMNQTWPVSLLCLFHQEVGFFLVIFHTVFFVHSLALSIWGDSVPWPCKGGLYKTFEGFLDVS